MIKKLLISALFLFCTSIAYADYYDLQHMQIVPDTTTVTNDWYFRGSVYIGIDTYTVIASSMPINIILQSSGTIQCITIKSTDTLHITSSTTFKSDGINSDFEVGASSSTFKNDVYIEGGFYPDQLPALPAAGYGPGVVIVYTGGGSYELYISTETVTSTGSWQKVADQ